MALAVRFAECLVEAGVIKNLGSGATVRTLEASLTSYRRCTRTMEAECKRVFADDSVMIWETTVTTANGKPSATIRHVQVIKKDDKTAQTASAPAVAAASAGTARTDRRDEIVRAATRIFSQKGFVKSSVKDVATEAGITTPTLYHYVETKEDLLNLVFTTTITKIDERLHDKLKDAGTPKEALNTGITALMDMYEEDSPVIMLLHEEARYLRPDDRKRSYELSAKSLENWRRLLREGDESGDFDVPDPDIWAQLVSILCTVRPLRFWNLKGVKADRLEEAVIEFVTRALEPR